jgi:hypothetical protein
MRRSAPLVCGVMRIDVAGISRGAVGTGIFSNATIVTLP